MPPDSRGSTSIWAASIVRELEPLRNDAAADVVVVGAGIAGMSVAHALVERGRSVIVLDDGPVGGGETSRTTAHLVTALDRRYHTIEHMHGSEMARLAAESHGAAVDRIERISQQEGIDCRFLRLDGYLLVPPSRRDDASPMVEREFAAATRAGVRCVIADRAPSISMDTGPCLRFPNQAQFDPMSFLHGLARRITAGSGSIFTGSHVQTVRGGDRPEVETSNGLTVRAGAVVVATNTPINDIVTLHTKQVACRTYAIGLRIPRAAIPPALFWDGFWDDHDEPYHYVRLALNQSGEHDTLIVGGEDHKTGREHDHDARYRRLESWARTMFPVVEEVEFRWSGQVMEPHDELAFIGRNPGREDNVYIATGDSGNGMTYAAIAAMMIPALIDGKDHPWKDLYSPARLPTGAPRVALAETAQTLAEYRDWVTPHPGRQAAELLPGEGAVIRINGKLRACYKGLDGRTVQRSAVCPHLLGVVRWNAGERSWDCPCHGSRFDCDGRVIAGPANSDLAEIPATVETEDPAIGESRSGMPAGQLLEPDPQG